MRNLLALIGLLVVLFAGLGWYMDWYQISQGEGDDLQVNLKPKKIGEDTQRIIEKGGEVLQELSESHEAQHQEKPRDDVGPPANLPGPAPRPYGPPNPVSVEDEEGTWWFPPRR